MNCDTMKSQVFPYVDGELPTALRDEMEAHFGDCESCRRVVEQELAFRDTYVARLRPDPTPPHLRDRINHFVTGLVEQRARTRRRWYKPWLYMTSAVVLLAVGVVLGLQLAAILGRGNTMDEVIEASVDQHQKLGRGLLPRDIVGMSPQAAEDWLRKRVDFKVSLPDLKKPNVVLVGARISHLANAEVAAIDYKLDRDHVSLFIMPEEAYNQLGLSEKPRFKVMKRRGFDVVIWRHEATGYTLVSEIGARACHVCHAPDATFDGQPLESFLRL
jgi:anti-sigma factor RsiW